MITVTIQKDDKGQYKGFHCFGHAGYAKPGMPDILCSAVSVLVINTMNCMEDLNNERLHVESQEENGYILCQFEKPLSSESIILMEAMIYGLQDLCKNYGKKYLLVKFEEV